MIANRWSSEWVAVCLDDKRSLLMSAPAYAVGRTDAYRSLTRTDLVLCVLPIAVFLSIVSLV